MKDCEDGKILHRRRDNKFGVTWCTRCGRLFTRSCGKSLDDDKQLMTEETKIHLKQFLDFLLKEGYCDTDVYSEPPTAIDQYLAKERMNYKTK